MLSNHGDSTEVLWPLDQPHYDNRSDYLDDDVSRQVQHDESDFETLALQNEAWRFCSASMCINPCRIIYVDSDLPFILNSMRVHSGNKPIM